MYAGEIVDGSGLSGKKVVTCSFAPFLIALGKNVFGKAVDAFKMPKFTHEVNPFFVTVPLAGRAGEQHVDTRKGLVKQSDEAVFKHNTLLNVLVALAGAGFKHVANVFFRRILRKIKPMA